MADGLSSADLRQRAAVGTAVANGRPAAAIDPLDDAVLRGKKIQAQKLIQQQTTGLETETLKAENERIKAEIEKQQLLDSQRHGGGGNDGWQEYLLTQMNRLQEQLAESQKVAQTAQQGILEERLGMLGAELERLRTEQAVPAPTVSASAHLEEAIATFEAARVLVSRFNPENPHQPIPMIDVELEKWKIQSAQMAEDRRLQYEKERRLLDLEMEMKREERAAEQARLDKATQTQERFFAETVPKLLEQGQNWFTLLQQRWAVGGAPAAPALPPAAAMTGPSPAPAPLPPGVAVMACQGCGQPVYYAQGANAVVCPHCFAVYGETETAPTPPGGHQPPPVAPQEATSAHAATGLGEE